MYKICWCYLTGVNPIRIDRGILTDTSGGKSLWFIADYSTEKFTCYPVTTEEEKILQRDHSEYAIMSGLPENFEDPFTDALEGLNIMVYEIEPSVFHLNKEIVKVIDFKDVESVEINKNFISS